MSEKMSKLDQLKAAAYARGFALGLSDNGFGHMVRDKESMKKAMKVAGMLSDVQEETSAKVRPILKKASEKALNKLASCKKDD